MAFRSPWVVAVTAIAVARVAWAAETDCPAPAAIAAELERLPDSGALARLGRSEVTAEGRTLRIVIRDGTGHALGVREVEAPRDCRQRAAVAAVVLAAWSHEWDVPAATVPPTPPRVTVERRRGELGLQAGLHFDGAGVAAGATALAGLQLGGPFEVGIVAGFVAAREHELGPGAIAYSLAHAGAGIVYRAESGATWIDGGLFPLLVRLGVTPRSLPAARPVALWTGALEGRFRLGLTWRRFAPFVCGSVGRRFVRDRLTLEDVPQSAELSPWDAQVGIGVAVGLGFPPPADGEERRNE